MPIAISQTRSARFAPISETRDTISSLRRSWASVTTSTDYCPTGSDALVAWRPCVLLLVLPWEHVRGAVRQWFYSSPCEIASLGARSDVGLRVRRALRRRLCFAMSLAAEAEERGIFQLNRLGQYLHTQHSMAYVVSDRSEW